MARIYLNNVSTKLTSVLYAAGTSCSVTAGDGALFAGATGGNTIRATLVKISGFREIAWEIIDITARSVDTLTITRAQEDTTALDFAVGDVLDVRFTAELGTNNTGINTGDENKNIIIGGDFTTNPWQRGTSFSLTASGYTADRWIEGIGITPGRISVNKTADAPTVSEAGVYTQHCLHASVTTADTVVDTTDIMSLSQKIEGYNIASLGFGQLGARYVTLSFWHKHTKTGTYCVSFRNATNTRSYVAEYTQTTSDTWEKAAITIPVDTTGTWLYDSGLGLQVSFILITGATYQTTANTWTTDNYTTSANQVNVLDTVGNNFKIALVKLEAGAVATSFEARDIGTELALCQRYYYRTPVDAIGDIIGEGYLNTTTTARIYTKFPTTMRTNPAVLEQSGTASDYAILNLNIATLCTSVPTISGASSPDGASVVLTTTTTLVAGQGCMGYAATTNAYLAWSAEL